MVATARSVSFRHRARDRSGKASQPLQRYHGQNHQVHRGEPVMPPRLIERIARDAIRAQAGEVLGEECLVVAAAYLGR